MRTLNQGAPGSAGRALVLKVPSGGPAVPVSTDLAEGAAASSQHNAPILPAAAYAAQPSAQPAADGRWARLAWLLTAAWTAMGLVLWVMFPMLSTVLLPLCAIAPLAWYVAANRRLRWYPPSTVTVALAVAAGYLLVNASWSLSLDLAVRTVVFVFVMLCTLHIVLNTLPELDGPPLRAMVVGALIGLGVAGAVLCLEVFSEQSLRRLLIRLVPALQPSPNHIAVDGGHLALAPYLPNANIAVLTLMVWPAALLVARLGLRRKLRYVALVAAAVAAATVLGSEHNSSQVALVGAGVVFALVRLRPKLALPLVVTGWVAVHLLVVPAAWLLYSADVHRAPWLPESARHRIVIWRYTVEQIHKAPLLGAGLGTGRALHEGRQKAGPLAPGTPFELTTNLHSHNAYLQVWYEAGAVGAAIMLGLGLAVLWALRAFSGDVQAILVAAFVGCALLAASTYSIWAPWFLASLAMAAIFAALGAALRTPPPGGIAR